METETVHVGKTSYPEAVCKWVEFDILSSVNVTLKLQSELD